MMRPRVDDGRELILPIEELGATVLREVAAPVAGIDPGLRDLVRRMFETMYAAGGQGLAAPQVGRGLRLAVVDVPREGPRHLLVNPRVVWTSDEHERGVEGCLSIPGVHAAVERPAAVAVESLGLDWDVRTIEATGELARCLQHEIDHLNGILYIDRLSPLNRAMTVSRYRKRAHRWTGAGAPGTRGRGGVP